MGRADSGGGEGGGGTQFVMAWPLSYGHRPSHAYNAGTEHIRVFTDQADVACTKREAP